MSTSSATLASLPPEIIERICSHIPKSMLLNLRLVSHYFESIATSQAFEKLQLKPYSKSPEHFINIAKSARLRQLVREITCDTHVNEYELRIGEVITIDYSVYQGRLGLMQALDYIRYFHRLEVFQLQFNEHFSWADVPEQHLRYQILLAIFDSFAGTWSTSTPNEISNSDDAVHWFSRRSRDLPFNEAHGMPETTTPIHLHTLSIRNLGYMEGRDMANANSLRTAICSGHLTNLQIHTTDATTVLEDENGIEETVHTDSQSKYEFYERLERVWLFPQAIENLRALSVTAEELWGWSPYKDIHKFTTGRDLPNLKALTLGNYVFSFQCQVDWIGSLKLESLSINRCAVLFRTFNTTPIERSTVVVGQDKEGNDMISKDCPTPEWWHRSAVGLEPSPLPLRWHLILNQWRTTMTAMRKFSMGTGGLGDFRYVDNVGETFCYKFNDDDVPGPWNHHFVLEPRTRSIDKEALDGFVTEVESRSKRS